MKILWLPKQSKHERIIFIRNPNTNESEFLVSSKILWKNKTINNGVANMILAKRQYKNWGSWNIWHTLGDNLFISFYDYSATPWHCWIMNYCKRCEWVHVDIKQMSRRTMCNFMVAVELIRFGFYLSKCMLWQQENNSTRFNPWLK